MVNRETKKLHKEGIILDKDKKRECIQKFLDFLYKLRGKTNKEAKETAEDVNHQKFEALTNKIIEDIEILLEFYKH